MDNVDARCGTGVCSGLRRQGGLAVRATPMHKEKRSAQKYRDQNDRNYQRQSCARGGCGGSSMAVLMRRIGLVITFRHFDGIGGGSAVAAG
jgi:hypothetical protein